MKRAFNFLVFTFFIFQNLSAQNVGIGTTTPLSLLQVADGNFVSSGTVGSGPNLEVSGAGTRMFFYPRKAAFRAGYTNTSFMNDNNIGEYSVAMGFNAMATGSKSFAVGNESFAGDNNAMAVGNFAYSIGAGAIALGNNANADGDYAAALGSATFAEGNNSVAVGSNIAAFSFAETAMGSWNTNSTPLSTSTWNAADRLFVIGNGSSSSAKSDAMVMLKNGNTGFGVATPGTKLEVGGKIKATNFQMTNGAGNGYLLQSDASGNASWVSSSIFSVDAGTGLSYSGTTLNSVWTASGSDIYSNNSGKVGIGTPTPAVSLHVYNSTANAALTLQSGSNNALLNMNAGASGKESSIASYTNGSQRWSFGKSNTAEAGSDAGSDFFINRFSDAGSYLGQPLLIKRSSGNIGIGGIADPAQKLDVAGNINISSSNAYYIGNTRVLSNSGSENVLIGELAGAANTGQSNTYIGYKSAELAANGDNNTTIGSRALANNSSGSSNIAIGTSAGRNSTGSGNVLIGYLAGNAAGSSNIMIGTAAGVFENGSNKLYIENSSASSPLIYGDFDEDSISINGSLNIAGALGLKVKANQVAGTEHPNNSGGIWIYASGTGTINLNNSAHTDRIVIILNNTGGARTISSYRDLSNTAQTTIANNSSLWVVFDGSNWRQIK